MYELKVTGGSDRYTNATLSVNGEVVGELRMKDEDFVRFCFDLLGNYNIQK
jgi:hypothetical protein